MFKYVLMLMLLPISVIANTNSCVVLLYHHIDKNTPKSTSVSPELFEQHLKYLQDNKFNVIPLKAMLAHLKTKTLPKKCVSLTADDAYISIYNNAYKVLKKYNMSLAVFVSSAATDEKYSAMMSWQQMREINDKYVKFYNHTATHAHLIKLSTSAINNEINTAQQRLNTELGVTTKIFAYPYGEANLQIYQQLQNLGYISFGQQSGAISYNSEPQNLARFPMAANFAKMSSFITKVNTQAMPINNIRIEPVLNNDLAPLLKLEFIEPIAKASKKQFSCFHNGKKITTTWEGNQLVTIKSSKKMQSRRNKYNCTMPSNTKNSYYWYSMQWINPNIKEN